jgi:hypothetical protein
MPQLPWLAASFFQERTRRKKVCQQTKRTRGSVEDRWVGFRVFPLVPTRCSRLTRSITSTVCILHFRKGWHHADAVNSSIEGSHAHTRFGAQGGESAQHSLADLHKAFVSLEAARHARRRSPSRQKAYSGAPRVEISVHSTVCNLFAASRKAPFASPSPRCPLTPCSVSPPFPLWPVGSTCLP